LKDKNAEEGEGRGSTRKKDQGYCLVGPKTNYLDRLGRGEVTSRDWKKGVKGGVGAKIVGYFTSKSKKEKSNPIEDHVVEKIRNVMCNEGQNT